MLLRRAIGPLLGRGLTRAFAKKQPKGTQAYNRVKTPAEQEKEVKEEDIRLSDLKEKEEITKHFEAMEKNTPKHITIMFAASTIPLYVSGYWAFTTIFDDPNFANYLHMCAISVMATNLFYVSIQ